MTDLGHGGPIEPLAAVRNGSGPGRYRVTLGTDAPTETDTSLAVILTPHMVATPDGAVIDINASFNFVTGEQGDLIIEIFIARSNSGAPIDAPFSMIILGQAVPKD